MSQKSLDSSLQNSLLPDDSQLVYLDFDGESTYYCNSDLGLNISVDVENSCFSEEQKLYILSALTEKYADTGIYFTTEKPSASQEYSTIFIGNTDDFAEYGDFAGLSETIDKNNKIKSDNAFVLANYFTNIESAITVIEHEIGHLVQGVMHDKEKNNGTLNNYAYNLYNETVRLHEATNNSSKTAPSLGNQSSSFVYTGTTMGPSDLDYIWFTSGITGTLTLSYYNYSNTEIYHVTNTPYYNSTESATPYKQLTISVSQGKSYCFVIKNYKLYQTSETYAWLFSLSGTTSTKPNTQPSNGGTADLKVQRCSVSTDYNGNITLNFEVANKGKGDAAASTVYIYDGTTLINSFNISKTPGRLKNSYYYKPLSYTIEAGTLSAGKHTLNIVVGSVSNEKNVKNNKLKKNIKVTTDLQITNLSMPSNTTTAKDVFVSFTVSNCGCATASETLAYVYNGKKKIGYIRMDSLAIGESQTYSFYIPAGTLSAGNRKIKIVADGAKKVSESNEKNNTAIGYIAVTKVLADLNISNMTLPATTTTNQTTELKFTVRNTGTAAAAASTAYIYNGSKKIGTVYLSPLDIGEQKDYSFSIYAGTLSAGKRKIKVVIDKNKEVSELNEKNNTATCVMYVEKYSYTSTWNSYQTMMNNAVDFSDAAECELTGWQENMESLNCNVFADTQSQLQNYCNITDYSNQILANSNTDILNSIASDQNKTIFTIA